MKNALNYYRKQLDEIREAGTFKAERVITTPQRARIDTTKAHGVINMCANNYLGLADNPQIIEAAKASYDRWPGHRALHLRHAGIARTAGAENRRFRTYGRRDSVFQLLRCERRPV